MLHQPHIAPLTSFVTKLRAHLDWEFPDFDPLDGGSNADIMFLLEKPGPMTSAAGKDSGFISRNNDDPTAEATFGFMKQADLPRHRTIMRPVEGLQWLLSFRNLKGRFGERIRFKPDFVRI
jgi:hypothetical protein